MSPMLDIICLESSVVLLSPLTGTITSPFLVTRLQKLQKTTDPHTGAGSTSKISWSMAATGITGADMGEGKIHMNDPFFWTEILYNVQEQCGGGGVIVVRGTMCLLFCFLLTSLLRVGVVLILTLVRLYKSELQESLSTKLIPDFFFLIEFICLSFNQENWGTQSWVGSISTLEEFREIGHPPLIIKVIYDLF